MGEPRADSEVQRARWRVASKLQKRAVGAATAALVITFLSLWASLESRPDVDGEADFALLYAPQTTGLVDLEMAVEQPIDLGGSADVALVYRARVSDPTDVKLVVSAALAADFQECEGEQSREAFSPASESDSIAATLRSVAAAMPARSTLASSSAANSPGVDEIDAGFTQFTLMFAKSEPYTFINDSRTRDYISYTATLKCRIPRERVTRAGGVPLLGTQTVLVQSFGVAAKMEGGGDQSLAHASYHVAVRDPADWDAKRRAFTTLEKKLDGVAGVWDAKGDMWWRNADTALGVYQPPGYALFEQRGANDRRAWLRLIGGFALSFAVGALVTAARKYITLQSEMLASSAKDSHEYRDDGPEQ